jgi:GntR family transcriptional regulator, transcriptional repressor for pyruvate dehydrogenase complex
MADEIEINWATLAPRAYGVPEELAARLERWLRDGSIAPGAKLPPERELAQQLGVSRASLREAMHELTLKGLLARKPGRGTVVLAPSGPLNHLLGNLDRATRDIREVADFRQVFEPHIAELAATRATPSNLRELHELCDVDAKAMTAADSVERDERFHSGLAHATHNTLLVALATTSSEWVHDLRLEAQRPARARVTSWSQHRDILAAIGRRDGGAARIAMREHIRTFADTVRSTAAGN